MFHVEHMSRYFILLIFCLFSWGCKSQNPNPELTDPIYTDLEKDKKDYDSRVQAETKQLEEFQQALRDVKPQTGQIKYAQKRVSESMAKLEKTKQIRQYIEIRIETRKRLAREQYAKAFAEGREWPDPKEYENYKKQRELEQTPLKWSVRERIEQTKVKPKPAEGSHH